MMNERFQSFRKYTRFRNDADDTPELSLHRRQERTMNLDEFLELEHCPQYSGNQ